MSRLWNIAPALILLACAVYLAVPTESFSIWRAVAAAVVAAPPAYDLSKRFAARIGLAPADKHDLELALRAAIVRIIRANASGTTPRYDGDVTGLGFHVWFISRKRRLVPRPLRRFGRFLLNDDLFDRWPLRTKLFRAAHFSLEPRDTADVPIRRGRGIIGRCLKHDNPELLSVINWERPDRANLLKHNLRTEWAEAAFEVNKGFSFDHAKRLSDIYGQAAAIILRQRGETIGCVTLDLPPGEKLDLEDKDDEVAQYLLSYLKEAANLVARAVDRWGRRVT
jgi:hypothetical protein